MEFLVTNKMSDYYCHPCKYKCNRKGDWSRHLQTKKHQRGKEDKKADFDCSVCGKSYFSRNGLWKHKLKCNGNEKREEINIQDKDALVMHLLQQNRELQDKIMELASETKICNSNNTNYCNTTNIHKNFNLNFFLNETCKDAMNITDFVDSIKVSMDDLENTGRQGYIKGISDIIINNLNKLEKHLRPLHCSDHKREILYIKDNNEWMRETDGNPILTKSIRTIANENIKQIHKWKEQYPDCSHADSMKNDLYLKIVGNSMNGLTEEEGERNINKIISNVAKKVMIPK
jgi:hypothetical protein